MAIKSGRTPFDTMLGQWGVIVISGVRIAVASIALCSTSTSVQAKNLESRVAFDPAEVAWFSKLGTNVIKGSAVLRTRGGDPKTCAGLPASLVPVSSYATDRVSQVYDARGFRPVSGRDFKTTDPAFLAASRRVMCDAQGTFSFKDLPDGDYYVNALVEWGAPSRWGYGLSSQGGFIIQRVHVQGGETKEILLSVF